MFKKLLARTVEKKNLTREEAIMLMAEIMEGKATSAQIASLLIALRMKGETAEEITGFAQVMTEKAKLIQPKTCKLIDTCGTGGDGSGTFNISTTVALVAASCGVAVAKHGNRAVSSKCGSADVLEALGIRIDLSPEQVELCIETTGIGFLFAPHFHPAMGYAAAPRKELGLRTIFNILGPLTNPASPTGQVLGVYHPGLTEVMAQVLSNLGRERAYVVYGYPGLDEISLVGETRVSKLENGQITTFSLAPEDLGLTRATMADIEGGNAQVNAYKIRSILAGEKGSGREIVLLNAAAALVVGEAAKDLAEGVKKAAEAIDGGLALEKLEQWKEFSSATIQGGKGMFLEKIVATKQEEIALAQRQEPLAFLEKKTFYKKPTRDFLGALQKRNPLALVAEVKKASPSKGVLCKNFNPLDIAQTYQNSGAAALSILTDRPFFQGQLSYLEEIKSIVELPLLRKDFIFTEYQIYQSKAYGADALLLIAALLTRDQLTSLLFLAKELGLACLVEVHNREELTRVLTTPAQIIGINNRDLHSFTTSLATTLELLPQIPKDKVIVSESGITCQEQVRLLAQKGVQAILVGEALVTSNNLAEKVQELIEW